MAADVNGALAKIQNGDLDGVEERLRKVADRMRIEGTFAHAASCCLVLANVLMSKGNLPMASATLAEADTYVAEDGGGASFLINYLDALAQLQLAEGDVDRSLQTLAKHEALAVKQASLTASAEYAVCAARQFAGIGDVAAANSFAESVPELLAEDAAGRHGFHVWPALAETVAFGVSGAVFAGKSVPDEFVVWRDALVAWSDPAASGEPLGLLADQISRNPPGADRMSMDLWRRALLVESAVRSEHPVKDLIRDARAVADQFGHVIWRIFWLRQSVERCGSDLDAERLDERLVELAQSTKDPTHQRRIFVHWAPRP